MKTALVLGGAECVFDDADAALELFEPDVVIAINDIALYWKGRVDVVATLHPEKFAEKAVALHPNAVVWSHAMKVGVYRRTKDWGGSSGLLAVKVAIVELKCTKVVLAGVPLDTRPNFTRQHKDWRQAKSYWRGWRRHHQEIHEFVRSMSGQTQQTYGKPTREWLQN